MLSLCVFSCAASVVDYENTVVNSTSLDNLPDFLGIARFHTYIGKNFDTSEINGENIRIYVSFVVEKDGN
jgi:protein TonB